MDKDILLAILDEVKDRLRIKEGIKLELKSMKVKAASISIKRGIIRLNKDLIKELDTDAIRYLIIHELIHYKLKRIYHSKEFYEYIDKEINEDNREELEKKIIEQLLQKKSARKPMV